MTKRRLERELEDLQGDSDDLEPDEWVQLALHGLADGHDSWRELLSERCPRQTYTQPDVRYTGRLRFATFLAQRAVYDLRTSSLEAELLRQRNEYRLTLSVVTDRDATEFGAADNDEAVRPSTLLGFLYVDYIAYERFAEEVLGVGLDTWAGVYPEGRMVVQIAAELLAENEWHLNAAEAELNDVDVLEWNPAATDRDDVLTLDDVAEQRYLALRETWDEMIAGAAMD